GRPRRDQAEARIGGREIAVIRVKRELRRQVVARPCDRLVAELPRTLVRQGPDARRPRMLDDVDRADAGADMRRDRPADLEVVDDVGHERVAVAAAAGTPNADAADRQFVEIAIMEDVFFLNPPRPPLVPGPRAQRVTR